MFPFPAIATTQKKKPNTKKGQERGKKVVTRVGTWRRRREKRRLAPDGIREEGGKRGLVWLVVGNSWRHSRN